MSKYRVASQHNWVVWTVSQTTSLTSPTETTPPPLNNYPRTIPTQKIPPPPNNSQPRNSKFSGGRSCLRGNCHRWELPKEKCLGCKLHSGNCSREGGVVQSWYEPKIHIFFAEQPFSPQTRFTSPALHFLHSPISVKIHLAPIKNFGNRNVSVVGTIATLFVSNVLVTVGSIFWKLERWRSCWLFHPHVSKSKVCPQNNVNISQ